MKSKEERRQDGLRQSFKLFRTNCRGNGIKVSIAFKTFVYLLTSDLCFYCGMPFNTQRGMYRCIDRIDRDIPYTRDNTVTCCTWCFHLRNNFFTPSEILELSCQV